MDLQRASGQGEAKAQQNPQPQAGPQRKAGGAEGAPVGFGVRFRIALAGRALQVHARGPGVGSAFGVDFGELPDSVGMGIVMRTRASSSQDMEPRPRQGRGPRARALPMFTRGAARPDRIYGGRPYKFVCQVLWWAKAA